MKYIFAVILFSVACEPVDEFAEYRDGLVYIVDVERHEEKKKSWEYDELSNAYMVCGENDADYFAIEDICITTIEVGQPEICHLEVYDISYALAAECELPVKKCGHNRIDCDGIYVWTFGDC